MSSAPLDLFRPSSTLDSDSLSKKITLLGTINSVKAILQLEKSHFNFSNEIPITTVHQIAHNDVYYWGTTLLEQDLDTNPAAKFNLIYPASEAHIAKYQKHPVHMVVETPEAYEKVVKPYIETQKGDRLQWVRNILYHGVEKERVVFKNDDYILLPDMKWDGTTIESLYLVCIVFRDDISSIRDLTEDDIPYLKRIKESILVEVPKKYGIARDQLRLYVHYQPSFYHFHIHVVNASYGGLGQTQAAGKAILLGEVIETLRLLGKKGYKGKSIEYGLSEGHDLWSGMKEYAN
ncbi:DEKNAAC103737 [Brettanomyces naardenensis]|uniref:DEKNAAC103737 n=1 Tax=Brettanomyces naardenensis TaxID=13370 RepID=A0A448YP26_BRENA|nr:DEKNAAC103737 [Brettanomyces naardenensis]